MKKLSIAMPMISQLVSLAVFSSSYALTAKEIMTKNEEARKLNEFETRAKLETNGRIKDFTLWRKQKEGQLYNQTFTRFHAPAEVRGEGILIVENASGRNEVLLYLPAYKKIRRVETQQQSGSFMGSAFSYSDIATPHVEDYQYKMIRDEACPTAEAKGQQCYVIECTPSNEDIRDRTGYSKSLVWVRHDNFMFVKAEYTAIDGSPYKKFEAREIKMIDPKNKTWLSHHMQMENLKTKEMTTLQFSNVKTNHGIPNAVFTQQNLKKE